MKRAVLFYGAFITVLYAGLASTFIINNPSAVVIALHYLSYSCLAAAAVLALTKDLFHDAD